MILFLGILATLFGSFSILAGVLNRPRSFWFGSYTTKKSTPRSMRINNIISGIVLLIIGFSLLLQAIEK